MPFSKAAAGAAKPKPAKKQNAIRIVTRANMAATIRDTTRRPAEVELTATFASVGAAAEWVRGAGDKNNIYKIMDGERLVETWVWSQDKHARAASALMLAEPVRSWHRTAFRD